MRAMKRSLILALALVLLAACVVEDHALPLDGRTFVSTSVVEDGEDRPLVAGTEIRLSFTDGQIGAQAGCNIFGGPYRVEDGTLVVEGGAMTEMGCDEERSAQDEWLFALLGTRPRIELSQDELVLDADGTVIALLDREVAQPDLELVGPTWTVESIIVGDAVASVPAGATANITFADDGTVHVNTGCNGGGGNYTIDGDRLRFFEVITTLRGCDAAAVDVEAAMTEMLGAGPTYAIDANTLTLMAGDRGLVLRGA
jgi:heat shock protein HslJ